MRTSRDRRDTTREFVRHDWENSSRAPLEMAWDRCGRGGSETVVEGRGGRRRGDRKRRRREGDEVVNVAGRCCDDANKVVLLTKYHKAKLIAIPTRPQKCRSWVDENM